MHDQQLAGAYFGGRGERRERRGRSGGGKEKTKA
jgi:hypothetical protein